MTLRDDLLPVFQNVRQLVQDLGLRQTRVFVRIGAWSEEIQRGDLTVTDTEILPRPKVAHSGRALIVSKITPQFDGGGWAPRELQLDIEAGKDFYFIVQRPDGGLGKWHLAAEPNIVKNFGYELTLMPLDRDAPDFPSLE